MDAFPRKRLDFRPLHLVYPSIFRKYLDLIKSKPYKGHHQLCQRGATEYFAVFKDLSFRFNQRKIDSKVI